MNVMDLELFKRIEQTQGKNKHIRCAIGQLTLEYFEC